MADIILTEEMKKKLAGFVGFNVNADFKYVPRVFRDPKNEIPKALWPVFTLRGIDGIGMAKAEDRGTLEYEMGEGGRPVRARTDSRLGTKRVEVLSEGIQKIRRMLLADGSYLSYSKEAFQVTIETDSSEQKQMLKSTEDIVRFIPVELQRELEEAIESQSFLTPEELRGLE